MLNDFLELESFYGRRSAALYIDEAFKNYGEDKVEQAVNEGFLETRIICIGPDCGRILCWLTQKGRQLAMASVH